MKLKLEIIKFDMEGHQIEKENLELDASPTSKFFHNTYEMTICLDNDENSVEVFDFLIKDGKIKVSNITRKK